MSEAWRNSYDAWKLSGPPEGDDDEEAEAREDARIRAENAAEDRMMEEGDFDRGLGEIDAGGP